MTVVVCKTYESLYLFNGGGCRRISNSCYFSLGRPPSEEIVRPGKVTWVRSKGHFRGLIVRPALSSAFNTASRFSSCSSAVRPYTITASK